VWQIRLSHQVSSYLKRLDRPQKERFLKALDELSDNPFAGDARPIKGRPATFRRRIGRYRLIFTLDYEANIIKVLKLSPRGEAY